MPDVKHFDPDDALDAVTRLFWRRGVSSTGMQDVVNATGLNRSSLYATFGGKQQLYVASLHRYAEQHSESAFERLVQAEQGLPAITRFFTELIEARCSGPYARWGCMIANAQAATGEAENGDLQVQELLDRQHQKLREALRGALSQAEAQGQLPSTTDPEIAASVLALLAYGVNLRSRAGAEASTLERTVSAALGWMSR